MGLHEGDFNALIEATVRQAAGNDWTLQRVQPLDAMAMHPIALVHGRGQTVFVKAGANPYSHEQFLKEAAGLAYIRKNSEAYTPEIFGVVQQGGTTLLVMEAIDTRPVQTKAGWEVLGQGLAGLHRATAARCGFEEDNYLGIWPQTNAWRDSWEEFFAEMRLQAMLDRTLATGHLAAEGEAAVRRLIDRLPQLCGPAQPFSLLHGDPWTGIDHPGNLLFDGRRLVLIDGAPYYGNREIDLSTVDIFCPVDPWFFAAYNEAYPLEEGHQQRKELWRINQRISFVGLFGPGQLPQLMEAMAPYL